MAASQNFHCKSIIYTHVGCREKRANSRLFHNSLQKRKERKKKVEISCRSASQRQARRKTTEKTRKKDPTMSEEGR